MAKKQTKVRVQQANNGQFIITIPELIAKNWLCVKKGDRVEFDMFNGKVTIFKIEENKK